MRALFKSTAHIFFINNDQILLLRRFNTGYEDGKYSVVAGHLEKGESVRQAAIREAWEEIGVVLDKNEIEVVGVMHRKSDDERIDFFLNATEWEGTPTNREPLKCDEITWDGINNLPSNTIPYIQQAVENHQNGIWYMEYGWT